jgi:hypothetical protein
MWSLAFSRSAASIAARSAGVGAAALGAVATLWREQALLKAAIESREIERSVLLLISPSRWKIRYQDDRSAELATLRAEKRFYIAFRALNSSSAFPRALRTVFANVETGLAMEARFGDRPIRISV